MQPTATREPVCLAAPGFGAHAGFCSSDEAGAFFLTANHTTWHPNQDLKVSANGAPAQQVPVYYTVGWWNQTQPIELQLTKGKNSLTFTRTSTRELVFKEFLLAKKIKAVGYNGTMRNAAREQSHSDFMRDLGKGPNP